MKTWKSYVHALPDGQSYSKRVTGSGHITVSALVTQDGELKAFPPRGAEKAYPVFISINATSGGKIDINFEGKYPQKGWELSSIVHKGYGRLLGTFMDLYREIHLTPTPVSEEEKISSEEKPSPEEKASVLFSEGWRFWENDREVVFNNQTIGGVSSPSGGENFVNQIFDLVDEKIEDIQDVLEILGQMTEEAGY